jgi:hypothetical protein
VKTKLSLYAPRRHMGEWTDIMNRELGGSKSQSEHPEGETHVLYTHRELNHVRLVINRVA